LDDVIGDLQRDRFVMLADTIRRRGTMGDGSPLAVGDSIPVVLPIDVLPRNLPPGYNNGDGSRIAAIGVIYKGVMFGRYVSIIFRSELGD
jgi:hypothetical protein